MESFDFLLKSLSGLYGLEGKPDIPAWRIAAEPFPLAPELFETIEKLGTHLARFYCALNKLYFQSSNGHAPGFIANYLEQGKPESVVKLMKLNRFKTAIPNVIRPDLLLTDDGLIACELDSVPGGMGFVTAMSQAYGELGYNILGGTNGMLNGFAWFSECLTGLAKPCVAIVVSDEADSYRMELKIFANYLFSHTGFVAHVCHPRELIFKDETMCLKVNDEMLKIDLIYRFFELFDLPNVAKHELILYAARHKYLAFTPPPKAQLEEKMAFSFLNHPALSDYWCQELGEDVLQQLQKIFPQTWILDPTPLQPQAAIHSLDIEGKPVFSWAQLINCPRKQRNFVVKPSGFSELAWGAHGVSIGNALSRDDFESVLQNALNSFEKTPYVLQQFLKAKQVEHPYFEANTKALKLLKGRVRLCPYYFYHQDKTQLGGILATISPMETDLVHGTPESILTVCSGHKQ